MAEYFSLVTLVLLYLILLDIWIYFYRRYLRRKILKALTFIYNECFFGKKTVKRSIPCDEDVLGIRMFSLEGVGDEVMDFFFTLTLIILTFIAWWTTSLSERPLMQTVFIVERRTLRRSQSDLQTIRDVPEPEDILQEGEELVTECKSRSETETRPALKVNPKHLDGRSVVDNPSDANAEEDISEDLVSEPVDPVDGVNFPDIDPESVLRNRRLAFFDARPDIMETLEVLDFGETDDTNTTDETTTEEGSDTGKPDDGSIRIRLKYLNDDQKLVEGRLEEQLGEFKRRHFSVELAAQKLVRLIFKGQVLQEDTKTLQNCGFFDNCVVHCLVQSRTPPPSPSTNRGQNEARGLNDNGMNWDLGNILFAGLSVLLGVAWYGRFHYAQLYTATTTVTLVGLTGIFTVSLIGMYMPDTDGIRA